MSTPKSHLELDAVLAIQFAIGWAGEARCSPPRLGWWETDLVDDEGGGDFFARLLPRTHAWAAFEAVREAASRVDARARGKMAAPDAVRTLFFLGFELDEQIEGRLAAHKRAGLTPDSALPLRIPRAGEFSREELAASLRDDDVAFTAVPHGRWVRGSPPHAADALVRRLAGALLPLAEEYPFPFFEWRA